ncbi:MAG: cell wall hydrolase [Pseudolabrys sp.]
MTAQGLIAQAQNFEGQVFGQVFERDDAFFAQSSEQRVISAAKIVCILLAGVSLAFSFFDVIEVRSLTDAQTMLKNRISPVLAAVLPGAREDAASEHVVVKAEFLRDVGATARTPYRSPYVLTDIDLAARTSSQPIVASVPTPPVKPQQNPTLQNVAPQNGASQTLTKAAPPTVPAPRMAAAPSPAPAMLVSADVPTMSTRAPRPMMAERAVVSSASIKAPPAMVLASASPDDLINMPPLENPEPLAKPASLTLLAPEASRAVTPPAAVDIAPSPAMPFPSLAAVPLPRPSPEREDGPLVPTPAELLGLDINAKERAKAERCLANAVYFESRSEPVRGQMAVAQVVMNRVFSPFYPKDVCSVVYQNASRRLACQFTFACDGKSKAIHDRGSWARAVRIAKQTLDGKLWVPEVAKSTHYHAMYVRPNWIHEMRRYFKTGLHLFYRPYNWGDGSDEPGWMKPLKTAAAKH